MRTISTSSYCPISARSGGTTSSSTASTSSTAVSCEAKGLAYKFARFWALPSVPRQQYRRFGRGVRYPATTISIGTDPNSRYDADAPRIACRASRMS